MSSIDLNGIDNAIKKIDLELEKATIKTVRTLALAIDQGLVLSTPVDTGRARGNWLPSLNAPILKADENTNDINGSGAIAKMSSLLPSVKFGDTIYITNNLAYIGRLNDGHSAQAPAGFVEKAVQIAESMVKTI